MKEYTQHIENLMYTHYAAVEAAKLEHGGINYIADLFGCCRQTVTAEFIKTNYDAIQEYYKYVDEHMLTSRESSGFKAHWAYSSVGKYKEN